MATIVDLDATGGRIEQAATLLHDVFKARSSSWQTMEAARAEVIESFADDRITRVALDPAGEVIGWVGGISTYDGHVWELHPLVVAPSHQRRGIGTALVRDLEREVGRRGGMTLWLGSDDEHDETSVGGVDLYQDIAAAIRDLTKLRGDHPLPFYLRLGFKVVGLVPDANGTGKPDILLAKRVGRAVGG